MDLRLVYIRPWAIDIGELWLLLIQLAGKLKRDEEGIGKVKSVDSRGLVGEYIEAGERLWEKLVSLLKRCEYPMLQACKLKERKRKTIVHKQGGSDDNNKKSSLEAKTEAGGLNKELEETSASSEGDNVEETGEQNQDVEKTAGVAFIETIFGRDKELERTEKWMQSMRLYKLRFDANCADTLRNPELKT